MQVGNLLFVIHRLHPDRQPDTLKVNMLEEDYFCASTWEARGLENANGGDGIVNPEIPGVGDVTQYGDLAPFIFRMLITFDNQGNRTPFGARGCQHRTKTN